MSPRSSYLHDNNNLELVKIFGSVPDDNTPPESASDASDSSESSLTSDGNVRRLAECDSVCLTSGHRVPGIRRY